jgi:hypothetical protein
MLSADEDLLFLQQVEARRPLQLDEDMDLLVFQLARDGVNNCLLSADGDTTVL